MEHNFPPRQLYKGNKNMFVIVDNNTVVLGPNDWNKRKFENFLLEEYNLTVDLPSTPVSHIDVDTNIKIYLVSWDLLPEINSRIEIHHGPFWNFSSNVATASYQVLTKSVDTIKSEMLGDVANKRWQKETEGVVLPLQNKLIWVTTQRNDRDIFLQAVQLGSDGATWKLTEVEVDQNSSTGYKIKDTAWLNLSSIELQQIVGAIVNKVQSAFDWENNVSTQIKTANTVTELAAIQY